MNPNLSQALASARAADMHRPRHAARDKGRRRLAERLRRPGAAARRARARRGDAAARLRAA